MCIDMTWQLVLPEMEWAGSILRSDPQNSLVFYLKDASTGEYLCEQADGTYLFSGALGSPPNALWRLLPFDDDVEVKQPLRNCLFTSGLQWQSRGN